MAVETLDSALIALGEGPNRPYAAETFTAAWSEVARRCPERRALLAENTDLTYAALWLQAASVDAAIRAREIAPGGRIAVLLDPGLPLMPALLGVMHAGNAYVPISNKEAVDRAAFITSDAACKLIISQKRYADRVEKLDLPVLFVEDIPRLTAAQAPAPQRVAPGQEAYVIYTSGTTGTPKGVRVTHHAMVHFGRSISRLYQATPEDVVQLFYSCSADTSVEEMSLALLNGGTLSIASEIQRHAPAQLMTAMQQNRVTIAILPLRVAAEMTPEDLPDLRLAVFGGEPVHAEIVNRWQKGGRWVYNGYGPTEATVACIQMKCETTFKTPPPIGRPMDNHFVLLIDPETRAPVPIGATGEIAVAGPGVALGYLNRGVQTDASFILNPYTSDAARSVFYLTGDYGRWNADRDLEYLGRKDRQVKVNGHRVEISEIENTLLKHPNIDFAAVIARPKPGGAELVAYVKLHRLRNEIGSYWDHMKRSLPFQMIPREVKLVSDVPLSRSGKVDRDRLDQMVIN